MKKFFILLIFPILIFSNNILIGSFNVLRLGESDKDYISLAKIISKFDVVALQEVMNEKGLQTLKKEIERLDNQKWGYILSEEVGSQKYKERYAVIYKKNIVDKIESLGLYNNGKSKDFIREPFGVKIKSNNFDFVIISVHSIFGNSKKERMEEAQRYHKVYKYFANKSKEEDILLMGDFNLEANDNSFSYMKKTLDIKEVLDPINNKTTISDNRLANSYDNMFFNRNKVREFTGRYGVYNFIKNNNKEIRKYISDHLLIFTEFNNGEDLDD